MIERLLEAILTALLVSGGGATADAPFATDPEDEDAQHASVEGEEDGGPPDFARISELIRLNVEAARARAAAAHEHAGQIREWTACIAANAANPEDAPRDDTFDPKIGCEDLRPATTPDGLPHGADDEEAEARGDEDAGPPSWVPGPPPWAGAGTSGADPDE